MAMKLDNKTTQADFTLAFSRLSHRGPNRTQIDCRDGIALGFHRLAVMDPSEKGNQPFILDQQSLLCNGEIFNYQDIRKELGGTFKSQSDCEVILPLIKKDGLEKTCQKLDGEFAFVIWDSKYNIFLAARDPIGIRAFFYGKSNTSEDLVFASEAKALVPLCHDIKPFPPGHYFDGTNFQSYLDICQVTCAPITEHSTILTGIHQYLTQAVEKRLKADVPIGFLLSGGLDSSLVCAIAQRKLTEPIKTFAIGMKEDPIDLKHAKKVAESIGSEHKEYFMTQSMLLKSLDEVIYHLESWDITTIRASLGMYLLCQFIRKESSVKVLLTGEVSDELFGYKYTDFAPSPKAFQEESQKRIRELHMYDVLRADRCISAHGLEGRVPFSDQKFVQFVMAIDPQMKMNRTGMGKALLREAFAKDNYLPQSILFREKTAFSDGVGHSLMDSIQAYCEQKYSDQDLEQSKSKYSSGIPFSKESLFYREIFAKHYPDQGDLICDYWMPNKTWKNCNVSDPSARVLPNYGKSAQ